MKKNWSILLMLTLIAMMITGCNLEAQKSSQEVEIKGVIPRLVNNGVLIEKEGQWTDGKFTGDAKILNLDGTEYEGNFVKSSIDGQGKLKIDDNTYFEGSFKNSEPLNGKYVAKYDDGENISEIKDGYFSVIDLSEDPSLKNEVQNVLNGAFQYAEYIPKKSYFNERDILEPFINLTLCTDKTGEYNYGFDSSFAWSKVPESKIDEYSIKYFDKKINHDLFKERYTDQYGYNSYYYKDGNYYFGYQPSGMDTRSLKVKSVYLTQTDRISALVDEYYEAHDEVDQPGTYSSSSLIELEKKDGRYVIKGAQKVNRDHRVTQGYKINQVKSSTPQNNINLKLFTEKPKTELFFNNIKTIYSKVNEKDKNNNQALDMIANDVDKHIEELFSSNLSINSQQIKITSQSLMNNGETINKYKDGINIYSKGIYDALNQAGINLRREPSRTIFINLNEYTNKDNFSFYIGKDIKEYLKDIDKIIFNISGFKITFDTKTLYQELENGDLIVALSNTKGVYNIAFKDANGNIKDSVAAKISIYIPLEEYNNKSVYYTSTKNSVEDNIGGQYDSTSKTIQIEIKTTGKLEIKESVNTKFIDIEKQNQATKRAIENLVSKGIMEGTSNSEFSPDKVITREEFTMAIVKTFYELDRDTKTSFTDVVESDKYYPYIASSEKENIVKGYPDKTFKGKNPITKEDVVSICARGLHEKKKYIYPEDPNEVLKFRDKDEILNYAQKEVALSVREGLIDNTKTKFNPQGTMTRAETAVIINRLIEKLY